MLEDVKANIARLMALYESERQRADDLSSKLARSEETVLKCKEQITDLNKQIDNLKLISAFTGQGDTAVARERVGKLIREIDKCIGLLEN